MGHPVALEKKATRPPEEGWAWPPAGFPTKSLGELVEFLQLPHQRHHGRPRLLLQRLVARVLDRLQNRGREGEGRKEEMSGPKITVKSTAIFIFTNLKMVNGENISNIIT